MTCKLARIFLILLLVIPAAHAQSTSPEPSPAEQKKVRAERQKKTLALVDEITKELESLKLPENRIRISIELARALWPRDATRARLLFKEAVASFSEIAAAIDNGDPDYQHQTHLPQQLRQEMVQIAATHDPRLAIDFLRATRTASTSQPRNSGLTNVEAQLEMRLAVQIAAKDPNEGLAVARESLKQALDYEALSFLYNLQTQQKPVAERFLEDILTAIRSYGSGNSTATPVAMTLLRTWIDNNRAIKDPAAPRTTSSLALGNLNEQTARELSNLIISALLSDSPERTSVVFGRRSIDGPSSWYPGMSYGMIQQLKPILPDIERLAPDQMPALRSRIVEVEKSYEAQNGPWAKYQELAQNGTPEALMEAAKTAPPEMADSLINQASWKAINQGDDERARQLIEEIRNPQQRAEMKKQLTRHAFSRAREENKVAVARALLPQLPTEEQAILLTQLAASSAAQGDKPAAFQLLGEAQSLLADRAISYGQLQAQVQIARGYQELDAGKSTAITEKVIDQCNELVAAALVLNGFDIQGYFRAGEFIITGGNPLNMMAQECGRVLGGYANKDLDRARSAAERFSRAEMRLIALMQIVQIALSDTGDE